MPNTQLDIRAKHNVYPHQTWAVAFEGHAAEHTYYLARLIQVDGMRFLGLVGDYSMLAEQARMSSEITLSTLTENGEEAYARAAIRVLGRLSELSSASIPILPQVLAELKRGQIFISGDAILIEFEVSTLEYSSTPISRGIALRT